MLTLVSAVQAPYTDSKILAEFFRDDEITGASDDLEKERGKYSGKTDLLNALELLQMFSLFSSNGEVSEVNYLNIE